MAMAEREREELRPEQHLRPLRAFAKIADPRLRRQIIELIEERAARCRDNAELPNWPK
jgi:hypothetical protein